ncbi:hypothetical protein FF38_11472 [Lucilia cuprina]|uniref:Uncharacterized protein n=1 Tax=Lucilia cuprina TaxID=7375 RepID=A0A0L0CNK2_LUCCU|nr:hypothetical protein FF38_11472 [Lucilia cuprina]
MRDDKHIHTHKLYLFYIYNDNKRLIELLIFGCWTSINFTLREKYSLIHLNIIRSIGRVKAWFSKYHLMIINVIQCYKVFAYSSQNIASLLRPSAQAVDVQITNMTHNKYRWTDSEIDTEPILYGPSKLHQFDNFDCGLSAKVISCAESKGSSFLVFVVDVDQNAITGVLPHFVVYNGRYV